MVVVMPGEIVLVEGEDVDVPAPVDVVVDDRDDVVDDEEVES